MLGWLHKFFIETLKLQENITLSELWQANYTQIQYQIIFVRLICSYLSYLDAEKPLATTSHIAISYFRSNIPT